MPHDQRSRQRGGRTLALGAEIPAKKGMASPSELGSKAGSEGVGFSVSQHATGTARNVKQLPRRLSSNGNREVAGLDAVPRVEEDGVLALA